MTEDHTSVSPLKVVAAIGIATVAFLIFFGAGGPERLENLIDRESAGTFDISDEDSLRSPEELIAETERHIAGTRGIGCIEVWSSLLRCTEQFDSAAFKMGLAYELGEEPQRERIGESADQLRDLQVERLPEFREAYASLLRDQSPQRNVDSRTVGSEHRTLDVVSSDFESDESVSEFHDEISEGLHLLRFDQVRYRQHDEQQDPVSIELETPSDEALGFFDDDNRWRPVRIEQ